MTPVHRTDPMRGCRVRHGDVMSPKRTGNSCQIEFVDVDLEVTVDHFAGSHDTRTNQRVPASEGAGEESVRTRSVADHHCRLRHTARPLKTPFSGAPRSAL